MARSRTARDATLAGLANGQAMTGPSAGVEGVRTTRSRSSLLTNAGHGVLRGGSALTTGQNEGAGRGAPVARMRSTRGHAARGNGVVRGRVEETSLSRAQSRGPANDICYSHARDTLPCV